VNLALAQPPEAIDLVDVETDASPSAPSRRADSFHSESLGLGVTLAPRELVAWIGEAPERLEAGLRPLHEDTGSWPSRRFPSDAGRIDLLFHDRDGAFVIVVFAGDGEEWIQNLLHGMDWVRKYLAQRGESVRAIVLVPRDESPPQYAALAFSDAVIFKTWQLTVSIEDIEI